MKVMIGHFSTESNGNIPQKNTLADYELHFGEGVIRKMQVKEVFDNAGIEIIPAVYAGAGPSGIITREAFDYIESCFVRTAREHFAELDGIYLFLHGASEVEGLGSGDIISCMHCGRWSGRICRFVSAVTPTAIWIRPMRKALPPCGISGSRPIQICAKATGV